MTTLKLLALTAFLFALTGASAGFRWTTLLSSALTITVLWLVCRAAPAAFIPLACIVFLIYFGVGWINTLDEAVLFQVLPWRSALPSLAYGAVTAVAASVLLGLAFGHPKNVAGPPAKPSPVLLWKLPIGAVFYFVVYSVAGAAIYPFIKNFYAGRRLPSLSELFFIQSARGLLYLLVALPLIKMSRVTRPQTAIILGGIAPLLLSNAYMPPAVRLAHSFEVGLSNFIYGLAMTYWLTTTKLTRRSN